MTPLTLNPTEEFFMAGEVMVRMWTGTDAEGLPVVAFIAGVGLSDGSPRAPILGNVPLISIPPPTPDQARAWAERVMRSEAG